MRVGGHDCSTAVVHYLGVVHSCYSRGHGRGEGHNSWVGARCRNSEGEGHPEAGMAAVVGSDLGRMENRIECNNDNVIIEYNK